MSLEVPKSVRQMGQSKGNRKIYIEDYVVSFAKQLAKQKEEVAGVLLGKSQTQKGMKNIYISGMVVIDGFAKRTHQQFSHDMWTKIYTDIKENFTDVEILGWYYSKLEIPIACNEVLRGLHGKNFAGSDTLLFIYEDTKNEEGFFLSTAGVLEQQKGYFIYYEKNVEMREYMLSKQKNSGSFEKVKDETTQNIRTVLQTKKGLPEISNILEKPEFIKEKKEGKYSIGLGTIVVAFAVLLGIVAFQNQNALNKVENQISTIKEKFLVQPEQKPTKTEVETLGGNLTITNSAITEITPSSINVEKETPIPTEKPVVKTIVESTPKTTVKPTSKPTMKPKAKQTPRPTAKPVQARPAFWYYIVKKGDTLSGIAQRYYANNNLAKKIKDYNGIKNEDEIKEGQKIKIPK